MLPFFDISSFSFSQFIVGAVPYLFGLGVIAFIVTGGVLDYHWRTYGVGLIKLFHFRVSYLVLGFLALAVMYVAYTSI